MRWRARTIVQLHDALRASRPQLKRDPLGGALPPHKHSSANSFGMLNAPGAERRDARANGSSPRPTAPSPPRVGRAAHFLRCPWLAEQLPKGRWAVLPWGAQRARAPMTSAPSNTRLKLAAPGS